MRPLATPLARLIKLVKDENGPTDAADNFRMLVYGSLLILGGSAALHAASNIVGRYRPHPSVADIRPDFDERIEPLYRAYIAAVHDAEPWTDVLADVHHQVFPKQGREKLGQHFTPPGLSSAMGRVVAESVRDESEREHGLFRMMDICSGTGSLLLGALRDSRFDPKELWIDAIDVDRLCCAMTGLQLTANSISWGRPIGRLHVVHGNALTCDRETFWLSESVEIQRLSGMPRMLPDPVLAEVHDLRQV